tara:strand:+ start:488 stop:676 length:189 start_codon:yes stop_codon:yes gene_type:complete
MLKSNKKVTKVKPMTNDTRDQLQFNLPRDYLLDKRIKPKDVFDGWHTQVSKKTKKTTKTKKK